MGAPSHRRARLQSVTSVLVIVGIVWFSRSLVDWSQVWAALQDMSWLELLTLGLLAAWNILTYLFVMVAALPGLTYRQAFVVGQSSTAVAATLPAGSALSIGLGYGMYASYGHSPAAITLATILTGVWNNFVKLGLPVVALAILAVQGDATGAETTAAVAGIATLVTAVGTLVAILWSDRLAARGGAIVQRLATPVLRLVRRPPTTSWSEGTVRFRNQTIALLRRRWHVLTVATLVSHLSLYAVLLVALRHMDVGEAAVSWAQVLAVFALMRLVTALPITPGGIGVVELGLIAGLVLAGGSRPAVVAAVLVFRVLTLFVQIPVGVLCYLYWRRTAGRVAEPAPDVVTPVPGPVG